MDISTILTSFLHSTIEYQEIRWEFSWLLVSFIATLIFDLLEGYEVVGQMKMVKDAGRARSLSTIWFVYFGWLLIAWGAYGIVGPTPSIALLFEGVLGLCCYLPMMVLLYRVRGFTSKEWLTLGGGMLLVVGVIFLPQKDLIVTVAAFGALFALALQPWEIYKERSRGEATLGLILIYGLNLLFWTIYGFATNIAPLMIVGPIALSINALTILLWTIFPERDLA